MKTIYHTHSVGDKVLNRLRTAVAAANVALRATEKQPTYPVPQLEAEPVPTDPVAVGPIGLVYDPRPSSDFRVALMADRKDGRDGSSYYDNASAETILRLLSPSELLRLTHAAESLSANLARLAADRAGRIVAGESRYVSHYRAELAELEGDSRGPC